MTISANEFYQEPKLLKKGLGVFAPSFSPLNFCLAFYCYGKLRIPCHVVYNPEQTELYARFKYREHVEEVLRNKHGHYSSPISVLFRWDDLIENNDYLFFTKVTFQPMEFMKLREKEILSYYNISVGSDAFWTAINFVPSLTDKVSLEDYNLVMTGALTIANAHDMIVTKIDFKNLSIHIYGGNDDVEKMCNRIIMNGFSDGYESPSDENFVLYMKRGSLL